MFSKSFRPAALSALFGMLGTAPFGRSPSNPAAPPRPCPPCSRITAP